MFFVLTQILLWILIAVLIWYVLLQLIPREYLTWLGGAILLSIIILAFFFPTDPGIARLWNILSFPLKPLGLTIILLLAALKSDKKKKLVQAAILILVLASVPWLSKQYEYWLIESNLPQDEVCYVQNARRVIPATGRPDAIVVLAKGTTQPFLPYDIDRLEVDMGDRIVTAAREYNLQRQIGNRPTVIAVGRQQPFPWYGRRQPRIAEADEIKKQLILLGVPPNDIIAQDSGANVRQSALAVQKRLQANRGLGPRIILVASALDMARAKLSFQNVGMIVIPRAANLAEQLCLVDESNRIIDVEYILPNAESLLRTTRVIDEFFTLIYYFLRGWIDPCDTCGRL